MIFYTSLYIKILIFFILLSFIFFLLNFITVLFNKKVYRYNKSDPIECGSHALSSGRSPIETNFYTIAIFFVILELESLLCIPWFIFWSLNLKQSVIFLIIFLIILLLGLVFEFTKGLFYKL